MHQFGQNLLWFVLCSEEHTELACYTQGLLEATTLGTEKGVCLSQLNFSMTFQRCRAVIVPFVNRSEESNDK